MTGSNSSTLLGGSAISRNTILGRAAVGQYIANRVARARKLIGSTLLYTMRIRDLG